MHLSNIDWIIIAAYFIIALVIGFSLKNRAGKSLTDFFLSGRNLPWYIAGLSMVATTFAADTPLAVTELVAQNGISGNWIWWSMLTGGMLTVFFFARLWRNANILTEPELIEIRYSGKPAAFLRGFKAFYLGLFMNCLIIGWVNIALITLLQVFFNITEIQAFWWVMAAMIITMFYSGLSGLWGVAITDVVQFVIAMTGCIILAVLVVSSPEIGGMAGLKEKVPEWSLNFFPAISNNSLSAIGGTLSISIGAFLAFIGVQWWASWYPGAEPGGGGYIAQRMMSCKNEKHSVWATLFFQIAHYALRPWPWIIVGLSAIVLYPDLGADQKKMGYIMAMRDYLPDGLKGLMLVAFFAAYMSTLSTQLNWGASYLVNDFYKRFIKPDSKFKDIQTAQKNYILWSRLFTFLIMAVAMLVTTCITTISGVWNFILECGAGLGLVLILRWYWWRINAWSEIVATIIPFIAYAVGHFWLEPLFGDVFIINKGGYFFTVGVTTISWILITYLTRPTNTNVLIKFYKTVKPGGAWGYIREKAEITEKGTPLLALFICWITAIIMTYSILFVIGNLIFLEWKEAFIWLIIALISGIMLFISIKKTDILK
jgi:SSS family solute:Na+ symporter